MSGARIASYVHRAMFLDRSRVNPIKGMPASELRRTAANPAEKLHDAAQEELALRARRDVMCCQQGAWEVFDVPGDAADDGDDENEGGAE